MAKRQKKKKHRVHRLWHHYLDQYANPIPVFYVFQRPMACYRCFLAGSVFLIGFRHLLAYKRPGATKIRSLESVIVFDQAFVFELYKHFVILIRWNNY